MSEKAESAAVPQAAGPGRLLRFHVLRHDPRDPQSVPRVQTFELEEAAGMTLFLALSEIREKLDSSLAFLAKSFSEFSRVRFNAVAPSLLKTSASAGIPGYVDSYLYAEQVIPRRRAVETQEAANVAAFLLSPRSSGINAQSLVVDAGMAINYFDSEIIRRVMRDQ